jgi:nucleobase transporter 1/2
VLITILFMWALCAILTVTDAVSADSEVRTDLRLNVVKNSDWIRFPYPCM